MQNVIIFGRGKFYQSVKTDIHAKYHVAAFLDNKIVLGMEEYLEDLNISAYNPADVKKAGLCPIIIMAKNFWELYRQLLDLEIDEKRILFGVELFPTTRNEKLAFSGKEHLIIESKMLVFKSDKQDVILSNQEAYESHIKYYANQIYKEKCPYIDIIANMPTIPASRVFGTERGKPIDRYYIEKFLDDNRQSIWGETLEIAETTYSLKYGEERIKHAYMLHVNGWGENAIKGNLETGEGLEDCRYDTLVITQTLMFTYDLYNAAENIYRTLRHGGTAFVTVAGISQISRYDADRWGSYYSFHKDALHRLFEPLFGQENVSVKSYGNVKTAIAMLYGLCCEDLVESDFAVYDKDYPVIIGAILHKV